MRYIIYPCRGLLIDDNALAADAYREAGIGTNYLGVAHTLRNFRTANFRSDLADNRLFEQWHEEGDKDMQQRAYERCTQMLAQYEAPSIGPTIDEVLLAFMDRKKSAVADVWY